MNPLEERIKELEKQVIALQRENELLLSNATIPFLVGEAFRARLIVKPLDTIVRKSPQALVTAPSGGATIDSEARTAINALITRLEVVGLILPN